MENTKFSLEKLAWIMRNCWFLWLLNLQSPHRMEAYVCRKPRSIKKEHERQENEIWKSAKLWWSNMCYVSCEDKAHSVNVLLTLQAVFAFNCGFNGSVVLHKHITRNSWLYIFIIVINAKKAIPNLSVVFSTQAMHLAYIQLLWQLIWLCDA